MGHKGLEPDVRARQQLRLTGELKLGNHISPVRYWLRGVSLSIILVHFYPGHSFANHALSSCYDSAAAY